MVIDIKVLDFQKFHTYISGDEMGTNTLLPLVTIIPALIGSGLISAGFIIHPLITINPKERGLTSKDISIWQVTGKAFIIWFGVT